jgi:hypothetical protein
MKALLVLLLLIVAAPAHAQLTEDGWPLHLALGSYMTLNGVDLSTTMYLIGSERGHEANPAMAPFSNRPALFGAVKIGLDSAVVYALLREHAKHPRLALIASLAGCVLETYASVHNYRLLPPVPR